MPRKEGHTFKKQALVEESCAALCCVKAGQDSCRTPSPSPSLELLRIKEGVPPRCHLLCDKSEQGEETPGEGRLGALILPMSLRGPAE